MNFGRRRDLRALRFCHERAPRVERHDRQVAAGEIVRGDAANIVERHFLDGREIVATEIQIAREQPVPSDIRRLATHRGQSIEMMTERDFLRLHQLLWRNAGLFHFVNDLQNQLLRGLAFFWIDRGIDAEQSRIAWCVRKRRDAKGKASLFPHAAVQTRAAPVA